MNRKQQFEWSSLKEESNLRKHRVSFIEASSVFADELSEDFADLDHSLDEERWINIGQSDRGRLIIVCYSEREKTIRIISARTATKREIKAYER